MVSFLNFMSKGVHSMIKQLSLLVRFFQEIIFDMKEEGDFKSRKFNARKFMIFGTVVLSMGLNYLLADRLYDAATKFYAVKKELKELKAAIKENNCKLPSDETNGVISPQKNPSNSKRK